MIGGQITLQSVTDTDFIEILKANEANASLRLSPGNITSGLAGTPSKQNFGNVIMTWTSPDGLKALAKLLEKLAELP